MAEYAVTGAELRRQIKFSESEPVAFAFRPGKATADHLLAMNNRRTTTILHKDAKEGKSSAKVAYGTARRVGNTLELSCEKTLPEMAKKMRFFLKHHKMELDVRIVESEREAPDRKTKEDAAKRTAKPKPDSKSEESPTDKTKASARETTQHKEREAASAPADDPSAPVQPQTAKTPAAARGRPEPEQSQATKTDPPKPEPVKLSPGERKLRIGKRAKAMQAALAAVPREEAGRLQAEFKTALGNLKSGDFDAADAALDEIDAQLARLTS